MRTFRYFLSEAMVVLQLAMFLPVAHGFIKNHIRVTERLSNPVSRNHRTTPRVSANVADVTAKEVEQKSKYNHLEVEQKWQKHWDENESFKSFRRPGKQKKYLLDMFPYPSGSGLHVGHPEGYTATDIMSRFYRMLDYDVLHPMGWDAFGLPAEQHAINTGTHPADTTMKNIGTFKRQLKSLGFSYDWSRELSTTDENYVKWTQWIFLQLFKADLAAQSEVSVNWCPMLGTVLANEEVINGLSERGDHPVVRMPLRQWVFKITKYADKLEEDLKDLDWPDGTLTAQKSWIGRSGGALVQFDIDGHPVDFFTTRIDTLMGVTAVVLAPEHPLVDKITTADCKEAVEEYKTKVASKSDLERTAKGEDQGKTGVFTGAYATHPISGEKVPVWIADYVLPNYGTGSVIFVPAHDERDFEFAKKFDLPIVQVVQPASGPLEGEMKEALMDLGVACNSGPDFEGMPSAECKVKMVEKLAAMGKGSAKVQYKLRDWVFSRQRYWGEPIPIYFPVEMIGNGSPIEGAEHKILYDQPIPVAEEDLPITLPDMTDFQPGDDPAGCLARAKEWRYFQKDGKWFARETNTMPQWAGSCWYYLRFCDPANTQELLSEDAASWMPVDLYVGGQEHAVLHLLYARFWHKVLFDLGIVKDKEPFKKLVHQGMILGTDGEKMSKSRGNVINPDDVIQEHGADALRLYEMFMGPLEATKPWQTGQLMGVVRFRDKILSIASDPAGLAEDQIDATTADAEQLKLLKDMHKTIKKVTQDIERMQFNTAISSLMIFANSLSANKEKNPKPMVEALLLMVSPFAPHVAEECWEMLGHTSSLSGHPWPSFDEALCKETTFELAVQVNGKVRGKFEANKDMSEKDVVALAMQNEKVEKFVGGKPFKKVIYVPGKILNLVVGK